MERERGEKGDKVKWREKGRSNEMERERGERGRK